MGYEEKGSILTLGRLKSELHSVPGELGLEGPAGPLAGGQQTLVAPVTPVLRTSGGLEIFLEGVGSLL